MKYLVDIVRQVITNEIVQLEVIADEPIEAEELVLEWANSSEIKESTMDGFIEGDGSNDDRILVKHVEQDDVYYAFGKDWYCQNVEEYLNANLTKEEIKEIINEQ